MPKDLGSPIIPLPFQPDFETSGFPGKGKSAGKQGEDGGFSAALRAPDSFPGQGVQVEPAERLDVWNESSADVTPLTLEIAHFDACPCGACSMKEEDDTLGNASAGDGTVSGEGSASAPALLGDMAEYLVTGFWGSSRFHNVTDSGIDPNNGVLTYNVTGYATDVDGISAERAALVREAFKLFEATLGIQFRESTSTNTSEVDFFFSDNSSGAYAGSTRYSNGEIGYSYINIAESWSGGTSTYDDYTFQTILHEIGHALGLGHQGDYNGSATYGVDNNFENDSWQVSMMSYFSQTQNTSIEGSYEFLQTPMSVDWMALDAIYGAQGYGVENAFTEDTVWGFNTTVTSDVSDVWANFATYGNRTASTIVDSGGMDTLDLSGYTNNTLINLAPSDSGASTPSLSNIGGRIGNLSIAEGTIIENAIGGAGSETFFGNAADNTLMGNGGNDTFVDSSGSDTYFGGAGEDTVLFEGLFSNYSFSITGTFLQVIDVVTDFVDATVEWFDFGGTTYSWQQVADTVGTPNAQPIATADEATLTEDGTASGNLLVNDTDPDGDTLSVVAVNGQAANVDGVITLASGARLTVAADGTYDYDPNGTFNGLSTGEAATDSFTYTVSDGRGGADTTVVTLEIEGVSAAPVARDDTGALTEGAGTTGNVLINDTDGDGDTLSVVALNGQSAAIGQQVTLQSGALLTLNADGSYDYDPNGAFDALTADQTTTDSFSYTVSDGKGGSDTATVTLEISGLSAAPVARNDTATLTETTLASGNVLANDTDEDADPLSVVALNGQSAAIGQQVALQSGALLTLNADGSYDYDPNGAFDNLSTGETATDSFTYTVSDGRGGADTAVVTLAIDGQSAIPVARDDTARLTETTSVTGNVLANDTDGDGDSLSVVALNGQSAAVGQQVTLQSGALLTLNANGSYDYDPNGAFDALSAGESATDNFSYTVSDGKGGTDVATVTLAIAGENPAPVDTPVLIDFETDALGTYFGTADIAVSGLSVQSGTTLSGARYAQTDGFTLTGEDFDLDSISMESAGGRVRVRIEAYDDGVLVGTATVNTRSNRTTEQSFGPEFDSVDEVRFSANGTFNVDNLALVTRPIIDPDGNNAPDAVNDVLTTGEGQAVNINLLANDSDPDGDAIQLTSVNGDSSGTVTLDSGAIVTFAADGSATYDDNGAFDALYDGQQATDSFVYAIEDGQGGSDQAVATVTIAGSGTPPPTPTEYQIGFEGTAQGGVLVEDAFNFDGITTTTQALGVRSGQQAGQSLGDSLTITRADGGTFDFDRAVMTALDGKNVSLRAEAYDDGVLIGAETIRLRDNRETQVNFDDGIFDAVDEVVLTAQNGFILDDLFVIA